MVQYKIEYDNVLGVRQCDYLGDNYQLGYVSPYDYNNIELFPFTRCCFSIGDWGIISALPEILKVKYPGMDCYIPTPNWIRKAFPESKNWTYEGSDPAESVNLVFKNNPHIKPLEPGQFSSVYCDHERCQRFENEPLVEQILRYFGFSDEEINLFDSRPNIYFSPEEELFGNAKIHHHTNGKDFGCILFASRLEHLNHCWDQNDKSIQNLIKTIKEKGFNKDYPIFYYTSFPIEETYWADVFNISPETFINFKDVTSDLRIQWYIKSKAKFNISYQSGFNDTVARYSDHYVATHRIGTGETTIKGVTYFQNDGSIIKYE